MREHYRNDKGVLMDLTYTQGISPLGKPCVRKEPGENPCICPDRERLERIIPGRWGLVLVRKHEQN